MNGARQRPHSSSGVAARTAAPLRVRRRDFLRAAGLGVPALGVAARARAREPRQTLFDGTTLQGWRTVPRLSLPRELASGAVPSAEVAERVHVWNARTPEGRAKLVHVGRWQVIDGAMVGGQEPAGSGLGAYLLSNARFADFELELEARPDWPVDTGIMLRAHELGGIGFQVLVDHRPNGSIGGIFGNGLGNFRAASFSIDGDEQSGFRVANLRAGEGEPSFPAPRSRFGAGFTDFARTWRVNDWNHLRIRCVGELPLITTWVNGVKICELDVARIDTPGFDPDLVRSRLGAAGHLAFEVHDNGRMGRNRWAPGAVCRWRNITLQPL
jgi:hypothetical protein